MFLRMWEYSSKKKPDYEFFLNYESNRVYAGNNSGVLLPYGDGPSERHKLGKGVYDSIISNAQKYLYIMTPYFIIDNNMMNALKLKAQSGVDVRIIIPGVPDKKIVYSLTLFNAEKLAKDGIRVYKFTPGFLHSKVMLSDDECAVIGSINLDFRSFYQQYESAAYIGESAALRAVKGDFLETFNVSEEILPEKIKRRNIFMKIWHSFIRLFAPLM